jgi:hypothetical protein
MISIRKLLTVTEEIVTDGGRAAKRPVRKVAAVAIIDTIVLNPLDWSPEQLELIAGEVLPRVKTVDGHGPSRSNVDGEAPSRMKVGR